MKSFFKRLVAFVLCTEAKLVLWRRKPKIIAVVGTVGKTSTKDAIFSALSQEFFVRKSEKSFNSEIGVPLTILGLPTAWGSVWGWMRNIFSGLRVIFSRAAYPEWLVLELGVDRPGDMKKLAKWIHPDVVVITRFASVPVHVEFFSSPEHLIAEKCTIISALKKEGLLVVNADDPKVLDARKMWHGKTLSYGFSPDADIRVSDFRVFFDEKFPAGSEFEICLTKKVSPVSVNSQTNVQKISLRGTVGKSVGYSAAAAFSVALEQRVGSEKIAHAVEKFSPPAGRMRLLPGIKRTIILDDSYNSSPVASEHALETLNELEIPAGNGAAGRKIAVLGDMLELGKFASEEHKKIGMLAGSVCDIVATVGIRARDIAEGALQAGMDEGSVFQFEKSQEAGAFLQNLLREGDIILVKGSQGVRTERVVEEIMEHPEKKHTLLVRQGKEWEKR